ncbi:sensor histidine kinase [Haloarcula onubensis]|uniref:histidine kinase n=1 Tax=Haloarcula onubensis TaxID=2950539 RepID=A0ABU2FQD4_9EURY|nr:HAMP domain-containing sensor histidine kinase [Halomicroarcula sp. S3CR25-11]MDS0282958.1 HAMP domain-containing histidine kinase [Halomicroarcula sp. S3CR25-11]
MRAKRGGAAVTVGTTGGLVAVPNALALSGPLDGPGTALAALGLLIGLALAAGAVLLVDSGISTAHVVRIAGWNGLGVVVLGLVLALVTLTGSASLPAFVAAGILGVSAVAHVLIGVNDVRRIRTAELAREREKLAVLNRVARHNLRNDAQVLHGVADLVDADTDPEVRDEASERVAAVGDDLASMSGRLREMQAIVDDETTPRTCSLPDLVERVVADCREQYPAATITVDLPDESVRAGERLETALGHLLENAIVHTDEQTVEVSASAVGETVTLVVADDGPGIPEMETEILTGERDRTQVEHASGLGLWVVKAAVEDLGGRVAFGDDGDGGEVRLQLPVA